MFGVYESAMRSGLLAHYAVLPYKAAELYRMAVAEWPSLFPDAAKFVEEIESVRKDPTIREKLEWNSDMLGNRSVISRIRRQEEIEALREIIRTERENMKKF